MPETENNPILVDKVRDRVVQTAAKIVIEPIFEADFEASSFGFRPRKSATEALETIRIAGNQGNDFVVDADIKGYLDTIPHSELLQCVARRIVDRYMLHLIMMWLKVPVEERDGNGKRRLTGGKDNDRGTPQGGVMTPRTQKITSNLSGGWNFDGNRVRIDACRIRLYVYDRCHARASPRRPSASIAHATYCCMSINSPMRSSSWRGTAPYRRVKPIATSNKLSA